MKREFFLVRRTHPGLFGVTLVEFYEHASIGFGYILWGRSYDTSSVTARHVYEHLRLFGFPLWTWGALHILLALAMFTGMAFVEKWDNFVKPALLASFATYLASVLAFLFGLHRSGASNLGILTYWQIMSMSIGLSMVSLYAYREKKTNPAMFKEAHDVSLSGS